MREGEGGSVPCLHGGGVCGGWGVGGRRGDRTKVGGGGEEPFFRQESFGHKSKKRVTRPEGRYFVGASPQNTCKLHNTAVSFDETVILGTWNIKEESSRSAEILEDEHTIYRKNTESAKRHQPPPLTEPPHTQGLNKPRSL